MKVLINFADDSFAKQQRFNSYTGRKFGGFDKVIEYSPNDIDKEFLAKHQEVFSLSKGAGLWLWKPYIIVKTLEEISSGDYLFYCDSGSYFKKPIDLLVECMDRDSISVMTFESQVLNIQFCKPEFFKLTCADETFKYSNQVQGGFILIKKNSSSVDLMKRFLELCENPALLTDEQSEIFEEPLFVSHRHDQSILSYLIWQNNLTPYRDPTQYAELPFSYLKYPLSKTGIAYGCFKQSEKSVYPSIICLYRKDKLYNWYPRKLFTVKHGLKALVQKLVFS